VAENVFEETHTKFQSILMRINEVIEQEGLKPGDRLPSERELVQRLQVGRSTVREALRALELLGIITTKRGQGTFLQPYQSHRLVDILAFYILRDGKSKHDLLEMRVLLETGAVKKAALHATKAEMTRLEKICAKMEQSISLGRVPIQEDYDFHHLLIRSAHNHLLTRIWHPVIQYGQTVRQSSLSQPGRPPVALREHHAILAAVKNRQPLEAAKRMEEHLISAGLPPLIQETTGRND
jgi:GntR family transcriptional repressor for pyruvate dehydrogenase complex